MKKNSLKDSWLNFHGRSRTTAADEWYIDFATRLLAVMKSSSFASSDIECQIDLVVELTTYLEDCLAHNTQGFAHFTEMYHKRYGTYLPFYELSADYTFGGINVEDIRFLLWQFNSGIDQFGLPTVENPFNEELLSFSNGVFYFMQANFLKAPVASQLLNDWLVEPQYMEIDRTPVPDIQLDSKLKPDVKNFLKASGGRPLMYFVDYDALKEFLVNALKWPDEEDSLMSELCESNCIVLYANAKGLIIAPEVSWCFADECNDDYNQTMASEEGYSLFCDKGCCPFDLLKYAMANKLFPEVAFPFENGKKLLHDNWDFVARWFLHEYYEGV